MVQISETLRVVLLAGLSLCPIGAAAQSQCPTAAMLDGNGIRFTMEGGDFEVHRMGANGAIHQVINYGGDENLNYLAHGVHVLQLSSLENGQILPETLMLFDFGAPISELPAPTPGGSWSARTTQMYAGEVKVEHLRHTWGALTQVEIGDCTLDAILVTVKFSSLDYDHSEEVLYFPELGTGVLTAYADPDGRDEYKFISVRAE